MTTIISSFCCRLSFMFVFITCKLGAIDYLTIIPLALVGYEMIDRRRVGYNHLISNKREWNNCFIKNNQEMLLDHADFALQEQAEDNLMVAFS